MRAEHLEILVEEPSMEVALRSLLPKIIGGISFQVYPYQCKQELIHRLPARLRGYSSWLPPEWKIVVILDRDGDDCIELKKAIETMAAEAGLKTPRTAPNAWQLMIRIAIEELEAWYFGDWQAVHRAFPKISRSTPLNSRYRDPDSITGGTWEIFERILQRAGYFKNGLGKIEAARKISQFMEPSRNSSRSFSALSRGLQQLEPSDSVRRRT